MDIETNKLNFTLGPVMMEKGVRDIGAGQIPYFRTKEFSDLMLENERLVTKLLRAGSGSRVVTLTGSGTAGMEAALLNTLQKSDRVLVVNGGGFGERFVRMCEIHGLAHEQIRVGRGRQIEPEALEKYDGGGFTAFVVNMHETTTGVLYDMRLIGEFCRRNGCFLIVDAISSFLADELRMEDWGINVVITGSQKAYAASPGLSLVALDEEAVGRVMRHGSCPMYFDFKEYLKDGERGQTPFTPAVGTVLQVNRRLCEIDRIGVDRETERVAGLARHFRRLAEGLPLAVASESMSNALTPLMVGEDTDAYKVFEILEERYGIWICPCGGELKSRMFRVGHIGSITERDNIRLAGALKEVLDGGAARTA